MVRRVPNVRAGRREEYERAFCVFEFILVDTKIRVISSGKKYDEYHK